MSETTIGAAVAKRDNGPAAQIVRFRDDYAALMPSHLNVDQWIRMAVGAIKGDKRLIAAAETDIGVFLRELRTAARLGLEPGTEQFYLTPRKSKAHGYRETIKGIVGYQGIVELIYRAGAVSSVIVEAVRTADGFHYTPGRDERPVHEVDWFGAPRGDLIGVYAYAVMKDGATSKVVVLDRAKVMAAKDRSDGADGKYSPWKTDEEAMWLKTAARRLAKWVPTSAEYRREQALAAAEVLTAADSEMPQPAGALDEYDEDLVDAEFVEDGAE